MAGKPVSYETLKWDISFAPLFLFYLIKKKKLLRFTV